MGKNCLIEYLTPACKTCPDWADGFDGRGIGCATHLPIGACQHFAKMVEERKQKAYLCRNCNSYDKSAKKCKISGEFTAKNHICGNFKDHPIDFD